MSISEQYSEIKREVREACEGAGRAPDAALLLAVSKTVGVDGVKQAISAGARDFGENRPEQLVEKHAAFPRANWHFIGNIQSRRIKDIVPCAYLIHSVHKLKHAKKISEEAAKIGKVQRILIEVNVSGEESKSGIAPEDAPVFLRECMQLSNVRVCGLMTMAPQGDMEVARDCFAKLSRLLDELREQVAALFPEALPEFVQLSMGMSEDWHAAVAEGSTIVRIGRAIFSPLPL